MTVVYEFTDCAAGEFMVWFGCDGQDTPCNGGMPSPIDRTLPQDESEELLTYNQEIALAELAQSCDDGNPCTVSDTCSVTGCLGAYQARYNGDIVVQPGGDGHPDVSDLLCALDGFRNAAECPQGDISPCGGDRKIDVGDVLAMLDAFAGIFACPAPCPPP